jgi:hypothetical protein
MDAEELAQLYAVALDNWSFNPNDENTRVKNDLERKILELNNR